MTLNVLAHHILDQFVDEAQFFAELALDFKNGIFVAPHNTEDWILSLKARLEEMKHTLEALEDQINKV